MNARTEPGVLVAIGLASAVLLAYQIAATRILSATVSYHAAFGVIALVMLGLAASGTRVYLDRKRHPERQGRITDALLWGSASFVVGTFLIVGVSAIHWGDYQRAVATIAALIAFFGPFYFVGYAISCILTEYAADVGRVYWSDLVGAAVGCWSVVTVLTLVTPIRLGLVCAVVLCVAAFLVSNARDDGRLSVVLAAAGAAVVVAAIGFVFPSSTALHHAKQVDSDPIWKDWNHLSRLSVHEHTPQAFEAAERLKRDWQTAADMEAMVDRVAIGWGLSPEFDGPTPDARYLLLEHDAGTPIIRGGRSAPLEILRWDVTAAAYHVADPTPSNVFIVGGGGGRDILTALEFGVESVDVVELNPAIFRLVQHDMADYSQRPYSEPEVEAIIGEARAELSRREEKYQLLQVSMIDTWASSTSGAMVLTENVLYTREAFDLYRARLTDDGVLTISRWYHPATYGEVGRLLSMVGDSLRRGGVEAVEDHVAILYARGAHGGYASTTLMKMSPFQPGEVDRLAEVASRMGFTVLWPPEAGAKLEIDVPALLRGKSPDGTTRYELEPATDDRPFFFNRYRTFGSYWAALQDGNWDEVSPATTILLLLLAIAWVASRVLVVRPLAEHTRDTDEFPRFVRIYFACLGLGFLSIELALIQRFTMYLGHPTYSLTVVLSALLLFGGVGSWLSQPIASTRRARMAALAVVGTVVFAALVVPEIFAATEGARLITRQSIAIACLAPVGVALGLMYPSGIRLLARSGRGEGVPWAWAINGIWGVYASIAGMLVAMAWGYTALFFLGAATYLVAWWALGRFPDAPSPDG